MEVINTTKLSDYLVKKKIFSKLPFFLIDVGAAGGIHECWKVFDQDLKAIGFEPIISECEQLNKKSRNAKYYPYYVAAEDKNIDIDTIDAYCSSLFVRSSAHAATEIADHGQTPSSSPDTDYSSLFDFTKNDSETEPIDQNHAPSLPSSVNTEVETIDENQVSDSSRVDDIPSPFAQETISLDRFMLEKSLDNPDFVKVDTDGFDYQVLNGAKSILSNPSTLGLLVECQFHGSAGPHSNTFRNIDRLLVENGFTMFALEPIKYSKKTLPGQFSNFLFGETNMGQVCWANALYLRDLARIDGKPAFHYSPEQILKLACLFEIYNLPDCAAELLLHFQDYLSSTVSVAECLNLLTKHVSSHLTYDQYLNRFNHNPYNFFPPLKSGAKKLFKFCKKRYTEKLANKK